MDAGERWKRAVSAQLADPNHQPFIASIPQLVIIGGIHSGFDWCWCQPTMVLHGCGHRHGEHRDVMD